MPPTLIVTTSDAVEGYPIVEYLGVVRGLVVRVPTISQGFQALGSALSGNFQAALRCTPRSVKPRAQAYERMVKHARELGADAVIAMDYDATDIGESATEVLAYGTAVKLKFPDALPVQE